MALPTFSQEGEVRVEYERRNAPRVSDHITRRGHVGPVPLPSESVFLPAQAVPTSPPRAAANYSYHPQSSMESRYQTPGNVPMAGAWPSSAGFTPAQRQPPWYYKQSTGIANSTSLPDIRTSGDPATQRPATALSAFPTYPSIHLSQADHASTPAWHQPHSATIASSPRPDPLGTPQGRAHEAWRIFGELGEQEGAPVPAADAVRWI
ncbi:hypothetical protein GGG16DRAFT_115018 [Schizophyllum commune]